MKMRYWFDFSCQTIQRALTIDHIYIRRPLGQIEGMGEAKVENKKKTQGKDMIRKGKVQLNYALAGADRLKSKRNETYEN